jgi:hypothetical protein
VTSVVSVRFYIAARPLNAGQIQAIAALLDAAAADIERS